MARGYLRALRADVAEFSVVAMEEEVLKLGAKLGAAPTVLYVAWKGEAPLGREGGGERVGRERERREARNRLGYRLSPSDPDPLLPLPLGVFVQIALQRFKGEASAWLSRSACTGLCQVLTGS